MQTLTANAAPIINALIATLVVSETLILLWRCAVALSGGKQPRDERLHDVWAEIASEALFVIGGLTWLRGTSLGLSPQIAATTAISIGTFAVAILLASLVCAWRSRRHQA